MTDLELYTELSSLPPDLKEEVKNFVGYLKTKSKQPGETERRKFGAARGFFEMSDDFDEPLEDFKEYAP